MKHNPLQPSVRAALLFPFAMLIAVIGGALAGFCAGLAASLFYLVLLFPLGMGYTAGYAVQAAVELATVRRLVPLLVLVTMAAVSLYGSFHYGRYFALQLETSLQMFGGLTPATRDDNFRAAKAVLDYSLQEAVGKPGFEGFLLYRAEQGVQIGRLGRNTHLHLGPDATRLYWLVEFGIVLCLTFLFSRRDALVPVCEACGSRYGRQKHLGGTSALDAAAVLKLLHERSFVELGRVLEGNAPVPSVEVYAQTCTRCGQGSAHLLLQSASAAGSGRLTFHDLHRLTLPPGDHARLLQHLPYLEP